MPAEEAESGVLALGTVAVFIVGGFALGLDPMSCAFVLLAVATALYFGGRL